MSADRNMTAAGEAVAQPLQDGIAYASAVIEFEATRARLELAIRCGHEILINETALQLLSEMETVREAHIKLVERLQDTIDRIPTSVAGKAKTGVS
jgi:hypothetical protein